MGHDNTTTLQAAIFNSNHFIEFLKNNDMIPQNNARSSRRIYMYYGGADSVVGVATMPLNSLLDVLKTT